MARAKENKDIVDLMVEWQGVEDDTVEFVNRALPHAGNMLTKTMLQVIKHDAEKHRLLQQMIVDSIKKEAVNLSPDELGVLSGYINRYLDAEGKKICEAETTASQSGSFITRYLLSYLTEDLKTQSCILKQLDDELKSASIPTSVTSKRFYASRTT